MNFWINFSVLQKEIVFSYILCLIFRFQIFQCYICLCYWLMGRFFIYNLNAPWLWSCYCISWNTWFSTISFFILRILLIHFYFSFYYMNLSLTFIYFRLLWIILLFSQNMRKYLFILISKMIFMIQLRLLWYFSL